MLVGALAGWLASILMNTHPQQGALLNILIGIVGAMLGRWILGDLLHIGTAVGTSATHRFSGYGRRRHPDRHPQVPARSALTSSHRATSPDG
ncbi:putative membrane protein YeaQ/YmgE (transglycosylase-associated protein family) [Deinococcus metalli]|uniref:Putative membrane protein YeaQ/YmgE (Transglycosylase-associated protein family) n=1 Tax=Deinococcus metalli TaxID=1141878 RepID=A0A7W8KIR7_9DEIO|nr:GlsB/YeaQ/YmgE family stress response membrane protein [Deinococcus metalli]MBB5378508.1 putative membrane protein YeaQ/YmgE (transglycosylase-associated protein family) [Deinococcus metalli]GHF58211.1 hypothetical protein GCM10017781_38090 [Deinococcus metalli]